MSTPFAQKLAIAKYIFGKKLKGEKKYPLVMELEPLFQCNLACAGCGKIQHPTDILASGCRWKSASPPSRSAARP